MQLMPTPHAAMHWTPDGDGYNAKEETLSDMEVIGWEGDKEGDDHRRIKCVPN